jgi:nitrite reductase/ring-hydroxylating ferredoxin subunit
MSTFHRVMPESDLPEGRLHGVVIAGRDLLFVRTKDGVHALDNLCNHGTARLSEGRLRGVRVICPLHGASFDCRNGALLGAPASAPQCAHPTRSVDGWIEVALEA